MTPWVSMFVDKNNSVRKRSASRESSVSSSEGSVQLRNNRWRPSSVIHRISQSRRSSGAVLESASSLECIDGDSVSQTDSISVVSADKTPSLRRRGSRCSLLTVVLVEAKGLPDIPTDGYDSHGLYAKLRLGSQSYRSKTVASSNPQWGEQFEFTNLYKDDQLKISLWDKGRQKNFMGSCVLDLSKIEKERTVEIWQPLNDGYGSVHLSVTMCKIRKTEAITEEKTEVVPKDKHNLFDLTENWHIVGELHVKVLCAKGLAGKPNSYCSLEVDNEKVRTHSVAYSNEPVWNQSFVFNVYDVTSTLDLKVYDSSLVTTSLRESIGRVTIPLLRIQNGQMRWYALKDKTKRNIARGNCPRVLLEMEIFWNPIKASLRLFRPKEVKYIKKQPKFDISLVYKNIEFIRDVFILILIANDMYKELFEWENVELSVLALSGWLIFWYYFQPWAAPLILLLPFFYFLIFNRHTQEKSFLRGYGVVDETTKGSDKDLPERSLIRRIPEIPEMTFIITEGIQYLASLAEKLYNLASFKVPFLSYLTMVLLIISSMGLYLIPFNYIMMMFGIYKFSRKIRNPERVLNNDFDDFLSRIPDTDMLNDWKELSVPEPTPRSVVRSTSNTIQRSTTVSEQPRQ